METECQTLFLSKGQPRMLSLSCIHSLRCAQGALLLEWEQGGLQYQHVLYGGGAPWQPQRLPRGTWLRLQVIGQRRATLVLENALQAERHPLHDALRGLRIWWGEELSALPVPAPFTKRNSRTG